MCLCYVLFIYLFFVQSEKYIIDDLMEEEGKLFLSSKTTYIIFLEPKVKRLVCVTEKKIIILKRFFSRWAVYKLCNILISQIFSLFLFFCKLVL